MRPSASFYKEVPLEDGTHCPYFGESNEDNIPHGRGIEIWNDGLIEIGYWKNGFHTGNCIRIFSDGEFQVVEYYEEDEEDGVAERVKGKMYMTDGTEDEFDEHLYDEEDEEM